MKKSMQSSVQDQDAVDVQRIPAHILALAMRKVPKSMKPGPALMQAYVDGNAEAVAIIEAWKPNLPIVVVSKEEHERMLEQNCVVFGA